MILGYLYSKGMIKNGSRIFNFWCQLCKNKIYQLLLIPMHIAKGYYYHYSITQIYWFIKGIIDDKLYKGRLRVDET